MNNKHEGRLQSVEDWTKSRLRGKPKQPSEAGDRKPRPRSHTKSPFTIPDKLVLGDVLPILTRFSKSVPCDRVPPKARSSFTFNPKKISPRNSQTGFLRLPAEIRNAIYDLCLESREIHIAYYDNRLISTKCFKPELRSEHSARGHNWIKCCRVNSLAAAQAQQQQHEDQPRRHFALGTGLLPLILTCKHLYSDLISLLYTHPTFLFDTYPSFLLFVSSMPTTHFHLLRSIRILQSSDAIDSWSVDRQFPRQASYTHLRTTTTSSSSSSSSSSSRSSSNTHPHNNNTNSNLWTRNTTLPTLPRKTNSWQHLTLILLRARNLRHFRLDVSDDPEKVHRYLGGCDAFWEELRVFKESRAWESFVVRLDRVDAGCPVLGQLEAMGCIGERRVLF